MMKFAALETLPDTRYLHVSGNLADSGERVVVSFGPEHGALEQRQVEMAMREFLAYTLDRRPRSLAFLDEVRAEVIDAVPVVPVS